MSQTLSSLEGVSPALGGFEEVGMVEGNGRILRNGTRKEVDRERARQSRRPQAGQSPWPGPGSGSYAVEVRGP